MKAKNDSSQTKHGSFFSLPSGQTSCITIRLDNDVLNWFRQQAHQAGSSDYEAIVNDALRQHIEQQNESFHDSVSRILRQELGLSQ